MLSSKYVLQYVLLTEYLTLNRCLSFPENTPAFHQFTPAFDKNTPAFSEKTGCLKTKPTRIKNDSRIFFFQNSRQSDRLYFHTYLSPSFYLPDSLINEVIQAFSVSDFFPDICIGLLLGWNITDRKNEPPTSFSLLSAYSKNRTSHSNKWNNH